MQLKFLTWQFIYHVRKEGRRGESEGGYACIPRLREEEKGGRVPGIPESQVTNMQTREGGYETDRWKTSGVKGVEGLQRIHASLFLGSCVVKPNSPLTAARAKKARLAPVSCKDFHLSPFTPLLLSKKLRRIM